VIVPTTYPPPTHYLSCIGGFFIAVSYGIRINRFSDPIIKLSEETFDIVTSAVAPGRFLVDAIPVLKHLPEWMPGAGFQALAKKWRQTVIQMSDDSYAATLKSLVVFAFSPKRTTANNVQYRITVLRLSRSSWIA